MSKITNVLKFDIAQLTEWVQNTEICYTNVQEILSPYLVITDFLNRASIIAKISSTIKHSPVSLKLTEDQLKLGTKI